MNTELATLTRVMKALSDPTRVSILKMLEDKELCVCEIQASVGLAQPTVTRHLKVLEDAGLVSRKRQGQWVNFSLDGSASPHAAAMLELLGGWLEEDEHVRNLRFGIKSLDRTTLCKS